MDWLSEAAAGALDSYYTKCRVSEQCRRDEELAAIVLQSCWRGTLQRKELRQLSFVALTIQKCWRGHLGRKTFAAAKAARNKELRETYFHQQASIIQSCWRGYFSRTRVHDFYKRKAYLAGVLAANAAVRAGMATEMQEALHHQRQQAEQKANQRLEVQVNHLHHLASTACMPGIYNSPAAVVTGQLPMVHGQLLEEHLRAASRRQAGEAVKLQQQCISSTIAAGFAWPAGQQKGSRRAIRAAATAAEEAEAAAAATAAGRACGSRGEEASTGRKGGIGRAAAAQQLPAYSAAQAAGRAASAPDIHLLNRTCGLSAKATKVLSGNAITASHARSNRSTALPPSCHKLAARVVAAVDHAFEAAAAPNMADGSFNPALSLQQSANYAAARQAGELERRIDRGVMLATHKNQPFLLSSSKVKPDHAESSATCILDSGQTAATCCSSSFDLGLLPGREKTAGELHWQHNRHSGGFFSGHLKQNY